MIALEAENISKQFIGHKALDCVSISIPKGSIYGLLGPNGAGKTTLIRIITQIIMADQGNIYLEEKRITPDDIKRIGYLPEERGLYKKMKVGEQLLYLARLKGIGRSEAIPKIKTWLKKLEIDQWWNRNVQDLSKGMQQKIQFIATILSDPEIIILDEPFSGFDPINADAIKNEILQLRDAGATIIFSTHRMESVEELCDHIALINKSRKILEGTKKDIKESFRTNTYHLEHKGSLHDVPEQFEVLSSLTDGDEIVKSEIKLQNPTDKNDFLRYAIQATELISFNEKVPTINEIFINQIKEKNHE